MSQLPPLLLFFICCTSCPLHSKFRGCLRLRIKSGYVAGGSESTPKRKTLKTWLFRSSVKKKAEKVFEVSYHTKEKGVFGIALSESIKYAQSSISYIDDRTGKQCFGVIPTVIAKCGSFLKDEGIFVEPLHSTPLVDDRFKVWLPKGSFGCAGMPSA